VDLSRSFIELKRESQQVYTVEIAVLLCENGPRRVIDQVYFVPLIVPVAQAAHPAK